MKVDSPPGATPIDPNEVHGLIPAISTQEELNELEAENIRSAVRWAERSQKLRKELLSTAGLLLLHRRMFEEVWE